MDRARTARARSWARAIAAGTFASAVVILADACVIADPPTDLPKLAAQRPRIIRESVVPTMSSVLGRWPTTFTVPVEVSDPLATIYWASFVDYDPTSGDVLILPGRGTSTPGKSSSSRVRVLEIPVEKPPDDECHVLEIVVSLTQDPGDARKLHTPAAPGGDIAMWLFNLSGDLSGCPVRDAGIGPIGDAEAGTD